jgi:predicted nucleic acid-binding Zn ribbon protein
MIDFSKKRKKGTRIVATIICVVIVLGMVIGLLVTTL